MLQDPDTAPLAKKIKSIFQDVGIKQDAPNLIAITSRLSKTLKKGVTLDSSYEEMVKAKPFAEKEIQAYQSMYDKTKKSQTKLPRPIRKGTRKLAEGAVPEGVLKTILTSIKSIPSKEDGGILRDAVITALIGYRGADVGGIQSSFEEHNFPDTLASHIEFIGIPIPLQTPLQFSETGQSLSDEH